MIAIELSLYNMSLTFSNCQLVGNEVKYIISVTLFKYKEKYT